MKAIKTRPLKPGNKFKHPVSVLRYILGVTQAEFGLSIGVSGSLVGAIEAGERTFSHSVNWKIQRAYSVNLLGSYVPESGMFDGSVQESAAYQMALEFQYCVAGHPENVLKAAIKMLDEARSKLLSAQAEFEKVKRAVEAIREE